MALVTNFRFRRALVLVALVLAPPRARAETVTHQFTGQITTITNGSGFTADLTGLFTIGQPVTLEYTIERDTAAEPQDPYTSGYTGALTALSFSIGSWSGTGTPSTSFTTVVDNEPFPGAGVYDQYSAQVMGGISAPPIGTAMLTSLTYTFDDVQASVFNSTAIPREFPDLGMFEGKTFTVLLFDNGQFRPGHVMATLAGVTTPTQPGTWGRLKTLYR
jgi:hypothetical protein